MPLVSIDEFARLPATHIVSLGSMCETAYNLRRCFDFSAWFPFDWWNTNNLAGLIAFLHDYDLDRLYDPMLLELSDPVSRGAVVNRHYDIWFNHEFPREDGRIREDFRLFAPKLRRVHEMLARRIIEMNDPTCRVVFVRVCWPREATLIADLQDALAARFPLATLAMLLPGLPDTPWQRANNAVDWRGDEAAWDALLHSTGIKLDNPSLGSFAASRNPNADARSHEVAGRSIAVHT